MLQWESMRFFLFRKSGQRHRQKDTQTHTRTLWLFNIDTVKLSMSKILLSVGMLASEKNCVRMPKSV